MQPKATVTGRRLRPEIQGLRALAVTSVLVYHLWPGALPGGFVGVDVFFVISGFLIGSHLLEELDKTGTLRLGRFWARRAKRLLPASLLVLLATSITVIVNAPLSTHQDFLHEVIGSALYVENWVLAHKSVDYLALAEAVSPVQHYWSLSAEEQFYVGLPLLLALIALVTKVKARGMGLDTVGLLAGVTVASFGYSVLVTADDPGLAYFSTFSRAWEFLAGVLLGCFVVTHNRRVRIQFAWGGLVLVVAAMVVLDDGWPFPGWVAAVPVIGTVLLLAAADAGPVAWASQWRPITWVGDISYAIYLWHWPLLVLGPFALGRALTTSDRMLVVVMTVALAWASTTFIELPVRTSPRLLGGARAAWVVALWCAVASLVVVGTAWAGSAVAGRQLETLRKQTEARLLPGETQCLGAAALDPGITGCQDLGDLLVPDPSNAREDMIDRPDCWATFGDTGLRMCTIGPKTGATKRVLAVGDSHSNALLPAYQKMAKQLGWRVDVAGRAACAWSTRRQSGRTKQIANECLAWKQALADHLAASPPYDLILTTASRRDRLSIPATGESAENATIAGLSEAWSTQIARGTPVVAIADNPVAVDDITLCMETHGFDGRDQCARPEDEAMGGFDAMARTVAVTPGSALVDMSDFYCPDGTCPAVIGNVVVYRNNNHLSATYVRTLAPYLIERVLAAEEVARRAMG